MRIIIIFALLLLSLPTRASEAIESILKSCRMQTAEYFPKNEYLRLIRRMEFSAAKEYCDTLQKDLTNCKASSRFWLGVESYAEGNFEEAELYFQDGLKFKADSGKVKNWISFSDGISGWGNPEDMLKYIQKSKDITLRPRYTQIVTYLLIQNTNAASGSSTTAPRIQKVMDPCLAAHGFLSLRVLRRHIELFSQGLLTMEIEPIHINQTGTKLDSKNMLSVESLSPWDRSFSEKMNQIIEKSDVIFFAFPREGGNAYANIGGLPIVQNVLNSPYRTYIRMPSEWLTIINLPQIFHEYMHTVEFNMIRSGRKDFHATSHGEDVKRVEVLTNMDHKTTGETDWAEFFFQNTIPALASELEEKKKQDGWEQIFGIHIINKNRISNTIIAQMHLTLDEKGVDSILALSKESNEMMATAYTAYNKEQNPGKAAKIALSAVEIYPYDPNLYGKAKWFIDFSRLKTSEKDELFKRLSDSGIKYGIQMILDK